MANEDRPRAKQKYKKLLELVKTVPSSNQGAELKKLFDGITAEEYLDVCKCATEDMPRLMDSVWPCGNSKPVYLQYQRASLYLLSRAGVLESFEDLQRERTLYSQRASFFGDIMRMNLSEER